MFLGSLGDSPYFADVDLNSTELGNGPEGLKVVKFKIQATIVAPQTAQAGRAGRASPGRTRPQAAPAQSQG